MKGTPTKVTALAAIDWGSALLCCHCGWKEFLRDRTSKQPDPPTRSRSNATQSEQMLILVVAV